MNLEYYDYALPKELIAQHPLEDRSEARLLVVERKSESISHRRIADLPQLLNTADVLVSNDTKVVNARLFGVRTETGGRWEGLFLEACSEGGWMVISKTRGKIQSVGRAESFTDREKNNLHRNFKFALNHYNISMLF